MRSDSVVIMKPANFKICLCLFCNCIFFYALFASNKTADVALCRNHVQVTTYESHVELRLKRSDGYHSIPIGREMNLEGEPVLEITDSTYKAKWKNGIELTLKDNAIPNSDNYHLTVNWTDTLGVGDSIEYCFDTAPYNWYGGGEMEPQPWPIQNQTFEHAPYIPGYKSGGLVAPVFLSSGGILYFVHPENPLFVSIDNISLCFKSEFTDPYHNRDGRSLSMVYDTFGNKETNITSLWLSFMAKIGTPEVAPSLKVFRDPIWSTWVAFKKEINQKTVLEYAQEIHDRGFPASQIEIDNNWETCYGEEQFDPITFPDPAAMIKTIHDLGYDVTLWVHPFINIDCPLFAEGDSSKYFVTNSSGSTIITSWWAGNESGYIDITNPSAREWWTRRLDALRALGVDSFKFDAGEGSYVGEDGVLNCDEKYQPGFYTTAFDNFTKTFGGQVETRVGYMSHTEGGIFYRFQDRESSWGLYGGLHSVITSTLHYGIVGYPYVLPDYIGGNAYGDWPDRELFIRWTELNAFLPVLQFSILPWSYDDEVTAIAAKMIELHHNVSDVLEACIAQTLVDGSPIIRPLWWINPEDETSQTVNDEFLLGSTYLVAPIITQGATTRDIYIPPGSWTDMLIGEHIVGPTVLTNYSVALDEIAYFRNNFA